MGIVPDAPPRSVQAASAVRLSRRGARPMRTHDGGILAEWVSVERFCWLASCFRLRMIAWNDAGCPLMGLIQT